MLYTIIDDRPGYNDIPMSFMIGHGIYAVPLYFTKEGAERLCEKLNMVNRLLGCYKAVEYSEQFLQATNRAGFSVKILH